MIALHWLAGALMLELIAHGWIMVHGRLSAATAFDLYQSHTSLGFVVLMLTAARLAARLARASPAPAAAPQWERRLAALVQGALDGSDVASASFRRPCGANRHHSDRRDVPCVVDRLIQQAMLQVLQERWDPTFSEHSYGFRPRRRVRKPIGIVSY